MGDKVLAGERGWVVRGGGGQGGKQKHSSPAFFFFISKGERGQCIN